MILLLENNIRGGISSVMGDRYVKSNENKKIYYKDAIDLYGWAMSEYLPYDEIKFDNILKLEDILNTPDHSDIGYFVEVDLKKLDKIKEKAQRFPCAPVNRKINPDDFSDYMKAIKPDTYTQSEKLISDWSNKQKNLVHYRMLKFYVRHGMIIDKVHTVISFKQSKWVEKYLSFITQKTNNAKNDCEKDFYKFLKNALNGETMEKFRNRKNGRIYQKR